LSALIVSRLLYMKDLKLDQHDKEKSDTTELSLMKNEENREIEGDNLEEEVQDKTPPKENAWLVFKQGITYLAKHKFILALIFGKGTGSLVWGAVDTATITEAQRDPQANHDPALSLSLIYVSGGIGLSVVPFLIKLFVKDESTQMSTKMLVIGLVTHALFTTFTGLFLPVYPLYLIANMIRCSASSLIWVYTTIILQQKGEDKYLGRIFSYDLALMTLAGIISRIVGGLVMDDLHWSASFTIIIYSVIGGLLACIWFVGLYVWPKVDTK